MGTIYLLSLQINTVKKLKFHRHPNDGSVGFTNFASGTTLVFFYDCAEIERTCSV